MTDSPSLHPESLVALFRSRLRGTMMGFLAAAIDDLARDEGASYLSQFEDVLSLIRLAFADRPWPAWPVNGLVEFNRMTLREEAVFRQTGEYGKGVLDLEDIERDVYGAEDVMARYYLVGLLMTYFTWQHHYSMVSFFKSFFLDVEPVSHFAEWGGGHGYYSLLSARHWGQASGTLVDISEHALSFSQRLLEQAGHGSQVKFIKADVLGDDWNPGRRVDRLICSELLEHVARPDMLLDRLFQCLQPGGRLFVTAALDAPQIDHVHHYTAADEVTDHVSAAGFRIARQTVIAHPARRGQARPPQVMGIVADRP